MKKKNFIERPWVLFLVCLIILTLPYIFTREAIYGISFMNTGNIGDTIGGITAPFVGLVSIILLYITLREQLKINRKQTNDSDFNKILNLQNQIQDKSANLTFHYDFDIRIESKGIFTLGILDNSIHRTTIQSFYFKSLLRQIKLIDSSIHQFLKINYYSDLDFDTKLDFYNMAQAYAEEIICFYDLIERGVIGIVGSIDEIDSPDELVLDENGKAMSEEEIEEHKKKREEEKTNFFDQTESEESKLKKKLETVLKTYKVVVP